MTSTLARRRQYCTPAHQRKNGFSRPVPFQRLHATSSINAFHLCRHHGRITESETPTLLQSNVLFACFRQWKGP